MTPILNELIFTASLKAILELINGSLTWDLIEDDYFKIPYAPVPFHGLI